MFVFASQSYAQCFTKISTGTQGHVVAMKSDNTFWTWGSNNGWQMGNEFNIPEYFPIQLSTLNDWIFALAGEENNTFVIQVIINYLV
ncbi:hypothetical protein H9X57_10270 [Flavobacterium piscinae]|uniref:hypothetical protein n=1 Tax=Flavobacterium piscinae TaxID=2506424 RepID=UPI0019AF6CB0|nr:hypothetical protein [Flavobacterium piscinae]MBC8883613.1 hypothetical protein [Flavobacterium piscinae]